MAERVVVARTRRPEKPEETGFRFTRQMVPLPASPETSFVRDYRLGAWEVFEKTPLPTPKDEAWRRTDLRTLHPGRYQLAGANSSHPDSDQFAAPQALLKPLVGEQHGGQVILLPQGPQVYLDESLSGQGVIFTDLSTAERTYPQVLARILGKIVRPEEGKFAALAGALADRGILVYVPRNLHVDAPLHSVLWGAGVDLAYFSHILVYLEEGASLTYVHEAASPDHIDGQVLHTGIVEIYIGAGANLRFVELQSWGPQAYNFSHERVHVDRDCNLDWIFGALGSRLTKNFSELSLIGEGATGRMSGFYFTNGDQHLDHDTQQNHLAPHTTSDLLFKGALKDQSRSVWQGMIYVAPGAQKADGYQANRNLILSRKAHADSIPGLEILADDVRCTHGATVGKIDADQVFYTLSRGIPYAEAERLIVEGFFDPIMQRIEFEGVRTRFQQAIIDKME